MALTTVDSVIYSVVDTSQTKGKIMRLEVYTPQGVFYGKHHEYEETLYNEFIDFVNNLYNVEFIHLDGENGDSIYMTKKMIDRSVFVVKK